tara:strand:- start:199 stop:435 length:237 start_codon:yes stop_codon:yes gene_type:complete
MKSKKFLNKDLKKLFKDELKILVNEKSKIYDHKNWDSLGNFNILLSAEKKFKIKFNSQEFSKLNSFKEILKVVTKKIK